MTVEAPFRFTPVHRWVWFPKWQHLVSHDVPFKDGISGELTLEITAKTPLLVGGPRRKPEQDQEGGVWPFETMDPGTGERRYAIPDTALQGMIRSILESAAFGRLGPWVDRRRFGFRDISGQSPTAKTHYQVRMTKKAGRKVTQLAQPGWLIRLSAGDHKIIPCKVARMHVSEVRSLKGGANPDPDNVTESKSDAYDRYEWFLGAPNAPKNGLDRKVFLEKERDHDHNRITIRYQCAFSSDHARRTPVDGTLVLTGKPRNGLGGNANKKFEFIFHGPDRPSADANDPDAKLVDKDVWDAFAWIHNHDELPGREKNPNWEFWRSEYEAGRPVPVFYLEDGGRITTFGTAFMFKMALPLSTHDLLCHSSRDHLIEKEGGAKDKRLDLPSLLFGWAADEGEDPGPPGIKRRVSFDTALATKVIAKRDLTSVPSILLEPKPSYYPIYVRQPGNQRTGNLDNDNLPYALHAEAKNGSCERTQPELSGVKNWPARGCLTNEQVPDHLRNNKKIRSRLHAVPTETVFTTTVRLHNLRPAELGALVWALTYGDIEGKNPDLRHRLGMGKPYGFGEIRLEITSQDLWGAAGECVSQDLSRYISALAEAVEKAAKDDNIRFDDNSPFSWSESIQVKSLLKSAETDANLNLRYMKLNPDSRINEFHDAKSAHKFLPLLAPDGKEIKRSNIGAGRSAAAPSERGRGQGARSARPALPPGEPVQGARVRSVGEPGKEGKIVAPGSGHPRRWRIRWDDDLRPVNLTRDQFDIVR